VFLTSGVEQSPHIRAVLREVMNFSSFTAGNDPYGEHDFGAVEVGGERYFFKIDYYDEDFEFGVDQYRDAFRRALTIMRADES